MRIIQRVDFEIGALGLSTGITAGLVAVRAGDPGALLTGALWCAGTVAAVYGVRIVGQALPLPSVGELGGAVGAFNRTVAAHPAFIKPPALTRGPVMAEDVDRVQAWRDVLDRFLLAADIRRSFSIRELGPKGGAYVSDYAWRALTGALKDNGILAGGNAGLDYAPGWEKRRARFHVKYERLTLPDGAPPRVSI